MNCKDAKDIDIVAYMQKLGFTGKVKGSFVWYCSPFRNEKTPSFSVNQAANKWQDFGTGQHGDVLDLVKLVYNTDTLGALEILSGSKLDKSFLFSMANTAPKEKESGIIINHLQPLVSKALIQYLNERRIPINIARQYTEEAYYTVNNKRFFSIAFRNDKGGYELRNKYFKNCSSPKYYTTFPISGSKQLNIFEGFFNFLSALAFYQVTTPSHNTIVLNSLSFLPHVLPLLTRYEKVNLFLDNDPDSESGQKAAMEVRKQHPNTINHASIIYPDYKDFNDFLTGKKLPL